MPKSNLPRIGISQFNNEKTNFYCLTKTIVCSSIINVFQTQYQTDRYTNLFHIIIKTALIEIVCFWRLQEFLLSSIFLRSDTNHKFYFVHVSFSFKQFLFVGNTVPFSQNTVKAHNMSRFCRKEKKNPKTFWFENKAWWQIAAYRK